MAATHTILGPLTFHNDKKLDNISASNFIREAESRMAAAKVEDDQRKIEFMRQCLRSSAIQWFYSVNLDTRRDVSFREFKKLFGEFTGIPSLTRKLDVSSITTQLSTENPQVYFARIHDYLRMTFGVDAFPSTAPTQGPVFNEFSAPLAALELNEATKNIIKVQTSLMMTRECANRAAARFDFLARNIWLFGLRKPFREMAMAAAEDSTKATQDIVRKVQAHFFSMNGKDKSASAHPFNKNKKVSVVNPDEQQPDSDNPDSDDEVAAANQKSRKKCSYCKKFGHVIKECRKKKFSQQQQQNSANQGKSAQRSKSGGQSNPQLVPNLDAAIRSLISAVNPPPDPPVRDASSMSKTDF